MLTCEFCGGRFEEEDAGHRWGDNDGLFHASCGRLVCRWKAEKAFGAICGLEGVLHWELNERRSGRWGWPYWWECK